MTYGRYGSFFGFRDPGYNPAERMCESMCGAIFGIFVFIGSIALLGWNEKRSVWTAQTIGLARDDMVQLDFGDCSPDSYNDGKLIALQGCSVSPSDGQAYAPMLSNVLTSGTSNGSFATKAFSWKRTTSQYVMHETKNGHDDYTYTKKWVSHNEIWSNHWGVEDCDDDWGVGMCYVPRLWPANQNAQGVSSYACFGATNCTAGQFSNDTFVFTQSISSWSSNVIAGFGVSSTISIPSDFWPAGGTTIIQSTALNCGGFLRTVSSGINPSCTYMANTELPNNLYNDAYGTFKWSWSRRTQSTPSSTSGLAVQYVDQYGRHNFKEWQNPHHSSCSYCTIGNFYNENLTGDEILDRLESENKAMTWALRFVGWLVMWFGLHLMVSPIAVAPQLIPCIGGIIGDIVGLMLCAMTCVIATSLSLLVIGIAWLAYRPSLGVPLVGAFIAGMMAAVIFARHQKQRRQGYGDVNADACTPAPGTEYTHIVQQPVQQYGQQQYAQPAANPYPVAPVAPPPGQYQTPYPPAQPQGGYPAPGEM